MPFSGRTLHAFCPRRPSRVSAAAALSTALALACVTGSGPAAWASDAPTIAWEPCAERFECGSVSVPWDHDEPEGDRLDIPVVRQQATDPAARQGVLVYNPGGPGIPGTSTLMALIDVFPAALQERFDIVAFDPRGTGGAGYLDCGTDVAAMYALDPRAGADSPTADAWTSVAQACADALGDRLADLSTTATARDVDLIREALGEERLAWYVTSYGTRLAAEYLRQFPGRVSAAVLDGAMDPSASLGTQATDQANAAEEVFERFLDSCWGLDPCPLGEDPVAAYDALASSVARAPLTTAEGVLIGPATLQAAALSATSLPVFWGQAFADALVSAQGGDGEGLFMVGPGSATDGEGRQTFDAQWAILCNDEAGGRGTAEAAELADRLDAEAPRVGLAAAIGWGIGCQAWPDPAHPIDPFTEPTAVPVLVIGSTGDPSTPYAWSTRMAEALGATLLTREGDGHTAFFNTFLAGCAGTAVVDFLSDPTGAAMPETCAD